MGNKGEKAQLIADIYAARKEGVSRNMFRLIDLVIDELREDNDTATGIAMYRNQGAIQAFTQLKNYFVKGLPTLS